MSDERAPASFGERIAVIETHVDNLLEGHREIKEMLSGMQKGAWGLALAIAGWALIQVYDRLTAQPVPHPPAIYSQQQR